MPGPAFLEGDTVSLHTIEEEDLEFLQRGRNHPDVRRPLTDVDPRNREQMEEHFENQISGEGDGFGFIICVDERDGSTGDASGDGPPGTDDGDEPGAADDPTRVGAVHVPWVRSKHGGGMLMYWVAPEHQGHGYATEATELVLDYAFRERRLAKVYALVVESNVGSQRVLEKLGFEREGVHRKETFVEGERRDSYRYGVLADEWLEN